MTEKRFCSEDYNVGYYAEIVDNEKVLDLNLDNPSKRLLINECVDVLNTLYEENQRLKDCEILTNHRGEMIDFANALIQDQGTDEMQELWKKFKDTKWREWRDKE